MRAVVASIVDPDLPLGGAWTSTRGLLEVMRRAGVESEVVHPVERRRGGMAHDARRAAALARASVGGLPAKPRFTRSRAFRRNVVARVRTARPDVVVLNGGDLLWLVDELPEGAPVVVVEHNLEHRLYLDQLRALHGPLRIARPAILRDARRLRRFELARLAAAGHAIFLSSGDAARAARAVPGLEGIVVPPVFGDGAPPRPARRVGERLELLLVANLDWWPNRQALEWLRGNVLPAVGDRARLHLVGLGAEKVERANGRIVRHGHVRSLERVLDSVDVAIGPTVAGGGVSVKVAEMAYRGMPLLVRPRALRGLPLGADDATVALDRASDWVAFLRSEDARRLARARPNGVRAEPFTIGRYVAPVARLLERAARSGGLRGPRRT